MAEIRINATGGVKLYDADDSHYAQILAGTISSNVDVLTLGSSSADFNIPVKVLGTTPTLTIGDAGAEDTAIVFDGNAQDFYVGLDDSADDLVIGLGSSVGTTPAISINSDRDVTISDGAIDFDIASHDTSNGLKLGGTLVTATAAELNIMDGVTSTATEINLLDGSAKSTSSITVADADGIIIIDGTTTKQIPASDLKTYAGFDVTSITGATALGATPADTDEFVLSDAGTLKRVDYSYLKGGTNTPAFFARIASTQTVSNNTSTKVAFATEVIDTDSAYDNSTNYRFTPQTAGNYFVFAGVGMTDQDNTIITAMLKIYKNGSEHMRSRFSSTSNYQYWQTPTASQIIAMNGSSDYLEVFGLLNISSGTPTFDEPTQTWFGAYKIIE